MAQVAQGGAGEQRAQPARRDRGHHAEPNLLERLARRERGEPRVRQLGGVQQGERAQREPRQPCALLVGEGTDQELELARTRRPAREVEVERARPSGRAPSRAPPASMGAGRRGSRPSAGAGGSGSPLDRRRARARARARARNAWNRQPCPPASVRVALARAPSEVPSRFRGPSRRAGHERVAGAGTRARGDSLSCSTQQAHSRPGPSSSILGSA